MSVPVISRFRRAWVWRLATLAVVVVVATLLMARMMRLKGGIADPHVGMPAIRTLAVLPFRTVGGKNGDDYVGIALADALITKLGTNQRRSKIRGRTARLQGRGPGTGSGRCSRWSHTAGWGPGALDRAID
jgi:hypothetical protein